MTQWQDIASAPKDGTRILVFQADEPDDTTPNIAVWLKTFGWVISWDYTPLIKPQFAPVTHWMPLPPRPPLQPAKEEK